MACQWEGVAVPRVVHRTDATGPSQPNHAGLAGLGGGVQKERARRSFCTAIIEQDKAYTLNKATGICDYSGYTW